MSEKQSDSAVVEETKPAEPQVAEPKLARPKPATRPKRKFLPQYAVIVENDDDHSYEYVMLGLCKVCGCSVERAFELAETIDRTGRAIVWTGSLEVAELKRDQILGLGPDFWATEPVKYPLGVTLEPLPG